MDEQENKQLPDDPPVNIDEDEVDKLLDQAQTLADDLASTAGVEAEAPDQDQDGEVTAQAPADDQSDPLAATEDVEQKLAELDQLVRDVRSDEAADSAAPGEGAAEPTEDQDAMDRAAGSAQGEDGGDDAVDDAAGGLAELPDGTGGPAGDRPRRSVRRMIVDVLMAAPRFPVLVAKTASGAILTAFVVMDRPFANVSTEARKRIGWIAVITVLMGIASLWLPGLIEDNPYESIEP